MPRRAPHPLLTPWGPLLAGALLAALSGCGGPEPVEEPLVCGRASAQASRQQAVQGATPEDGRVGALWQCGPTLDFTPVNAYGGELAAAVGAEDAVALIDGRCTGTLVEAAAGPVVLTAGHCVGPGDRPLLVFNFEDSPDGDPLIVEGTVVEQSLEPDYALITLDRLPEGVLPVLLSAVPTERLAILQHPRGHPKVVAEGRYVDACDRRVYYADLDTLVGSSGAGVLNARGHLLAVHTDGNCDESGRGTNSGWTVTSLVEASAHLQDGDVVER